MNVEVQSLDQVRKKIEVILPEETIKELESEIYEELRKQARVKGFRQGKTPKSIIASFYKDYIDEELKKRMVQSTMGEALFTAKVSPLVEPFVDFVEEEGKRGYTLECEVGPEIEIPEYKGIEIEVDKIVVTDEDVEKRVESLRNMHADIVMKEGDEGAATGDYVVIKYQAYDDGKPVKDVATEAYPLELGSKNVLPEFESALTGMKAGEETEVTVPFADDYPDKDIASKTLVFKIALKEIREKRLPEINDAFVKDLSFESVEAMKEGMKKEIEKEKEAAKKKDITEKIIKKLVTETEVPVPKRLLEKRTQSLVEEAKSRFKGQRLADPELNALDENLKKQFEPRAEVGIKAEIVLSKIAEKEGIMADDSEVEQKIKSFADEAQRTYREVRDFYEQYNMIGGLKQGIMEEKTLDFIKDHAILKEKE
jgi:trigger factor